MAFDECTEYPADHARARHSMELTARWARRSKEYFEAHKQAVPWFDRPLGPECRSGQSQALFGIVQGGM